MVEHEGPRFGGGHEEARHHPRTQEALSVVRFPRCLAVQVEQRAVAFLVVQRVAIVYPESLQDGMQAVQLNRKLGEDASGTHLSGFGWDPGAGFVCDVDVFHPEVRQGLVVDVNPCFEAFVYQAPIHGFCHTAKCSGGV
jgi:hypothetical protein